MPKETTIPLTDPFDGHGGAIIKEIVLREPSPALYYSLGDPASWVKTTDSAVLVEADSVIEAYLGKCIIKPDPVLAIAKMSLADAMKVKDGLLDFFSAARMVNSKKS
jgi:hypothetical protein